MRGSVYRRGQTWTAHVTYKEGGKVVQPKRGGYPTRREAEAALTEMLRLIDTGVAVEPSRLTVASYLGSWCDHRELMGLRASTIVSYRAKLRQYVLPRLGDLRLQALEVGHVDGLWREMADRGLSSRTIRYTYTIVRKALDDAERKGIVMRNVAKLSSPPSAKSARAPSFPVWSADDLGAFLAFIDGWSLAEPIYLAAVTGMRRGELCALRWSELDLDAATITVERAVAEGVVDLPKSDKGRRVVELDGEDVSMLRRHRTDQLELRLLVGAGWVDEDLVFPRPDGRMLDPDTLSQQFDRLVRRSGLPRIRFHDLRHTHGTLMAEAGVDAKTISTRLGHASVAFTLDTYVKPSRAAQREAARAVGELVRGHQRRPAR